MEPRRIGIVRVSPAGVLVAADDAAAAITGFASPDALVAAGSAIPLEEALAEARAARAAPAPASYERTWQGPAGEDRCTRVLLMPIGRGAGGGLDHFQAVVEELDPRSCHVPASSVGFVESLLDGLPNPVFVKDERHRWVLLNAAACRFIGHDRGELLGRSDFEFFPPEEARVFWEKDDAVFANGGINENEERFTDASGRTHVIVTRKTLHVDAQGRRFLLGVITDITALREATEQLQASHHLLEVRIAQRTAELSSANALLREHDAQRAAFLNLLGHELRNPISAIATSAALMDRLPGGSPAVARARAVVGRQVGHLTRLCDDLLDSARLAHGKLELHLRVVDLSAVLANLCDDLRAPFDDRDVALSFEAPGEPLPVKADETRLAQAFGNLIHNALKFTPTGGRVDVTLRRHPGGAEVVVRDTGAGIPPEELEHVFEPFVQASGSPGSALGGLGIGLPLAKGLLEAHGGTLAARSEGEGRGVEMRAVLPLATAAPRPEPGGPAPSPRPGLRVVLIEDDRDFGETLAELLRLEGYRVDVATSGSAGVDLARSLRPDAVVCDLGLPGLDGYAVARSLRSDPALADARLVALSGFAHPEAAGRALEAGFDAHLPKPPSLARLEELLGGPAHPPR
jgi:PAS domain S-box-containing protein